VGCVFAEVRTECLNVIKTSFDFKELRCQIVKHRGLGKQSLSSLVFDSGLLEYTEYLYGRECKEGLLLVRYLNQSDREIVQTVAGLFIHSFVFLHVYHPSLFTVLSGCFAKIVTPFVSSEDHVRRRGG
jgi:hypothetical protein